MRQGLIWLLVAECGALDFHMTDLDFKFVRFINQFNKRYSSQEEFDTRKEIFARADEAIQENQTNTLSTHHMAHNTFSDMTDEEFRSMLRYVEYDQHDEGLIDSSFCHEITEPEWSWQGKVQVTESVGEKASVYKRVPPNRADCLRNAIREQPVLVSVQADSWQFKLYGSGVIGSEECGTTVNHNMMAVGYGSQDGVDYYLLKNSWGFEWGIDGFVKVKVEDNGLGICGVQASPICIIVE